jgi:hypothetical protein
MSFQAYLDAVEKQTGKTPQQIVDEAGAAGFGPDRKAGEVTTWLKATYGIGHGHANAMTHVIRNGPQIGDKHVGSTGSHRDESNLLRLDGIANR